MNERASHKYNLEEGFELVPQTFEEYPKVHITYDESQRFLVFDSTKSKVIDRPVNSFMIYRGNEVPEAIERFEGVTPEKFSNSYVVYVR